MHKLLITFSLLLSSNCFAAGAINIELLKDINPFGSASISVKLSSDTTVYFMADDGVHGSELWKTDGTSTGTVLVKDITTGSDSSFLSDFIWDDLKQAFYFTDGSGDMWQSDGESINTQEIYSAPDSSQRADKLFFHNGQLLFLKGPELVTIDLVTEAITSVSDFTDGDYGTLGFWSVSYQGLTYFTEKGFRKTDGTPENTELIIPIPYSVLERPLKPRYLFVYNDLIYFIADDETNGEANLWQSDGTAEGTNLLKDLNSGSPSTFALNSENPDFFIYAGKLYFRSYHSSYGYEIWSTDGSQENTVLLKDIYSGSFGGNRRNGVSKTYSPTVFNDYFYFVGQPGDQLWRSDGSAAGTSIFLELGTNFLTKIQPYIYFSASVRDNTTGVFSASEVWLSGGEIESTQRLNENDGDHIYPTQFHKVNGKLIFNAFDAQADREWRVVKEEIENEICLPIVSKENIAVICF